jgi:hypothetical protein
MTALAVGRYPSLHAGYAPSDGASAVDACCSARSR